jgi:hypothetical protein
MGCLLRGRLRFVTALFLLCWWSAMHVAPAAAGLAPSRMTGETSIASTRDADLVVVQRALEHRMVAQKLLDYGVSPDEVKLRLATMSDEDLHELASVAHGLPSGGDSLGVLVTILIIILLVILIVKLLNKEIVIR